MEISEHLDLHSIEALLNSDEPLQLSEAAKNKIVKCFEFLHKTIDESDEAFYGINTGFGSLCNTRISKHDLKDLQRNLLLSHACGMGDVVPNNVVSAMLLLKVMSLAKGHSGVKLSTVEKLLELFNSRFLPKVYQLGSLGASGDLSPLAHLALPLIGEGELFVHGAFVPSKEVIKDPIELEAKESLALINGTQFMLSYGVSISLAMQKLLDQADLIGALSLDTFDGRPEPFEALSHDIRPHLGQKQTAQNIRDAINGSTIQERAKEHVQDPYSFRCMPQVHGASRDVLTNAISVFTTEMNAVTDNPNIFPDNGRILSAGNFHGQPLAMQLDFLTIALSELGSISERRTFQLLTGSRGLPHFLTQNPGLHSGLMIAQYTAASIASKNKQLCTPSSADSIVSSNGQEDHVSMGANAATKCYEVLSNTRRILAIELLCASQALDLRRPWKSSAKLEHLHEEFRKVVPFVKDDTLWSDHLLTAEKFLEVHTA